jgi:hypothetical protein
VASQAAKAKSSLYTQYPLSSVALYNGLTVAHFVLGGLGVFLGFSGWAGGIWLSLLYVVFAFGQMYLIMPMRVCPNCAYYRLDGARCISALNLLSHRIAGPGRAVDFRKRARGPLCHNNLYLAALIAPVPLIILGMVFNFSVTLLAILVAVIVLALFRFFILIPKVACVHCYAKAKCPNAEQMGLNK